MIENTPSLAHGLNLTIKYRSIVSKDLGKNTDKSVFNIRYFFNSFDNL